MRRRHSPPTISEPLERDPLLERNRLRHGPPRSTDAVANALHDIRDALRDLGDRVEQLEDADQPDNTALDNDLRELSDRIDSLENQIGV